MDVFYIGVNITNLPHTTYFRYIYTVVGAFIGPEKLFKGPNQNVLCKLLSIEHQLYILLKLNFSNDNIIGIFLADDGPLRSILSMR